MDHKSSTPEPPRERAVSSEPCSTRPNPFDDDDASARKRRRTSHSTDPDSSHTPHRPAASIPSPIPRADSNMKVDSVPSTPPRTPEAQQPPPSAPGSSRVTINLRNSILPSAVQSPHLPARPAAPHLPDDIKISVEESEVDANHDQDSVTIGSPSDSPNADDVEVLAVETDDEMTLSDPQSSVAILTDLPIDPTIRFPYREQTETYWDVLSRLYSYLTASWSSPIWSYVFQYW